jgi:hypothetical protein
MARRRPRIFLSNTFSTWLRMEGTCVHTNEISNVRVVEISDSGTLISQRSLLPHAEFVSRVSPRLLCFTN